MMKTCMLLVWLAVAVSCCACAGAAVPESTMRWAERLLAEASRPPTDPDMPPLWWLDLQKAEDAFQRILTKHGPDSWACVGLARSHERQGEYTQAVKAMETAHQLAPDDSAITLELKVLQTQAQVARVVADSLPAGHRVLRALRYEVGERPDLWLVLSAEVEVDPDPDQGGWRWYRDIHLALLKRGPNGPRQVWQSEQLGYPGYTEGAFNGLQLYLLDINGDGKQEAVIPKICIGACSAPSHVDVFALGDVRLEKLLGVTSDLSIWVEDLNDDGRYEVLNLFPVGWNLCHAVQPYWHDIYAYKGGAYQLADGDFPDEYRELHSEIRKMLKSYPDDWELHKFLGITYGIIGKPQSALRELRRAETECRKELKSEDGAELRSRLRWEIEDLRTRTQGISARARRPKPQSTTGQSG